MTKIYSDKKIKEIKRYRLEGHTMTEIVNTFNIPKTSAWHHIKNLKLSEEAKKLIRFNQGGSHKRMLRKIELAKKRAIEIKKNENWHSAVVLAMLYWAEGSKKDFCFTNSDGSMVKLFLKILKKTFKVKKDDLLIVVRLVDGMNKNKCLDYWSDATGLPRNDFVVRMNDGLKRMKSEYGISKVFVRKGRDLLKLINAVIELEKKSMSL